MKTKKEFSETRSYPQMTTVGEKDVDKVILIEREKKSIWAGAWMEGGLEACCSPHI